MMRRRLERTCAGVRLDEESRSRKVSSAGSEDSASAEAKPMSVGSGSELAKKPTLVGNEGESLG